MAWSVATRLGLAWRGLAGASSEQKESAPLVGGPAARSRRKANMRLLNNTDRTRALAVVALVAWAVWMFAHARHPLVDTISAIAEAKR